jgi:tRNA threonylcarbamoyl adenosine modification protein YeaZ
MAEDKKNSEITFKIGKGATSKLYSAINFLLTMFDRKITDIEKIILNQGPGSFTGIRVAMAFAAGFCTVSNSKIVPIPFHEVIAFKYGNLLSTNSKIHIAVVLSGMRNELFVQKFTMENNQIINQDELKIIPSKNIDSFLENIDLKIVDNIKDIDYKNNYQHPIINCIDLYNFAETFADDRKMSFEPIYLRKSAAREKKEDKI